ncbi:MAG TPA: hypothetical protein VI685_01805 [Candidatus Angelobacter sp.]
MRVRSGLLLFLVLMWCPWALAGDESERPAAPEPKPAHRFLDLKNSLAISSFAVTLAGDSLSTQKGLARPGYSEINPIARLFVRSRAGAVVYSAGSFGLVTGGMYLAHKTGHHKLERIVPFGLAAWEGFMTARNYRVTSHPR